MNTQKEFKDLPENEAVEILDKLVNLRVLSKYGNLYFFSKQFAKEVVKLSVTFCHSGIPDTKNAMNTACFMVLLRYVEPAKESDMLYFMQVINGILSTQDIPSIIQRIEDLVEKNNIPE